MSFCDLPGLAPLAGGPPYWLVRVSGLYLGPEDWLVGSPRKALVWTDIGPAVAKAREVRSRKLWLGRVVVVRRRHLNARQW